MSEKAMSAFNALSGGSLDGEEEEKNCKGFVKSHEAHAFVHREPDDSIHPHVYADALEEVGHEDMAHLVRHGHATPQEAHRHIAGIPPHEGMGHRVRGVGSDTPQWRSRHTGKPFWVEGVVRGSSLTPNHVIVEAPDIMEQGHVSGAWPHEYLTNIATHHLNEYRKDPSKYPAQGEGSKSMNDAFGDLANFVKARDPAGNALGRGAEAYGNQAAEVARRHALRSGMTDEEAGHWEATARGRAGGRYADVETESLGGYPAAHAIDETIKVNQDIDQAASRRKAINVRKRVGMYQGEPHEIHGTHSDSDATLSYTDPRTGGGGSYYELSKPGSRARFLAPMHEVEDMGFRDEQVEFPRRAGKAMNTLFGELDGFLKAGKVKPKEEPVEEEAGDEAEAEQAEGENAAAEEAAADELPPQGDEAYGGSAEEDVEEEAAEAEMEEEMAEGEMGMEGGMGQTMPQPPEPYGAQCLRRLHEDGVILLQDYEQMLFYCEDPMIQQLLMNKQMYLTYFIDQVEQIFARQYAPKGLMPLNGQMIDAEGEVMPGGEEEDAGSGLPGEEPMPDDDADTMDDAAVPADSGDTRGPPPTEEESYEASMKKPGRKSLEPDGTKAASRSRAAYTAATTRPGGDSKKKHRKQKGAHRNPWKRAPLARENASKNRWVNTRTGEVRYQDQQPAPTDTGKKGGKALVQMVKVKEHLRKVPSRKKDHCPEEAEVPCSEAGEPQVQGTDFGDDDLIAGSTDKEQGGGHPIFPEHVLPHAQEAHDLLDKLSQSNSTLDDPEGETRFKAYHFSKVLSGIGQLASVDGLSKQKACRPDQECRTNASLAWAHTQWGHMGPGDTYPDMTRDKTTGQPIEYEEEDTDSNNEKGIKNTSRKSSDVVSIREANRIAADPRNRVPPPRARSGWVQQVKALSDDEIKGHHETVSGVAKFFLNLAHEKNFGDPHRMSCAQWRDKLHGVLNLGQMQEPKQPSQGTLTNDDWNQLANVGGKAAPEGYADTPEGQAIRWGQAFSSLAEPLAGQPISRMDRERIARDTALEHLRDIQQSTPKRRHEVQDVFRDPNVDLGDKSLFEALMKGIKDLDESIGEKGTNPQVLGEAVSNAGRYAAKVRAVGGHEPSAHLRFGSDYITSHADIHPDDIHDTLNDFHEAHKETYGRRSAELAPVANRVAADRGRVPIDPGQKPKKPARTKEPMMADVISSRGGPHQTETPEPFAASIPPPASKPTTHEEHHTETEHHPTSDEIERRAIETVERVNRMGKSADGLFEALMKGIEDLDESIGEKAINHEAFNAAMGEYETHIALGNNHDHASSRAYSHVGNRSKISVDDLYDTQEAVAEETIRRGQRRQEDPNNIYGR